jgi:hypothetical protein
MNQRTNERQFECPGCLEWHDGDTRFSYTRNAYLVHRDSHGRRWHESCWAVQQAAVAKAEARVHAWVKARRVRRRAKIIRNLLRVAAAIFSI